MLDTIGGAELRCIRYAGTDRSIQARLAESDDSDQCDDLLSDFEPQAHHIDSASNTAPAFAFLDSFDRPSAVGQLMRWFSHKLGGPR